MSLQIRRGTAAELANITPVVGELIYTTDSQVVYVGDGSTAGGIPIAVGGSGNVAGTNILTTGIVSATGNIVGNNFIASGFVSAAGNVTGNYVLGNGAFLTGVATSYGNANVVANLAALSSNPVSSSGNVTAGNLITGGVLSVTGNTVLGNLNIIASRTIDVGNNRITNLAIPSSGTDAATKDYVDSTASTGFTVEDDTANTTIIAGGDTLQLYGTSNQVSVIITNNDQVTFGLPSAISISGNVTGGNLVTGGLVTATGNITGGNLRTGGVMSATGNITGGNLSGTNIVGTLTTASQTNITSVGTLTSLNSGTISSSGNITGSNLNTGGVISATGNVSGNNINLIGNIIDTGALWLITGASGNVTMAPGGTNVLIVTTTGANITGTLNATGNANLGNVGATNAVFTNISGTLSTAAQTNITSLGTLASLSVTGNVDGGNIQTVGQVSATGNVSGNFFIGNGSQLTGITVGSGTAIINGTSNVSVALNSNVSIGVAGTPNVAVFASTGEFVSGLISATGNITGGNVSGTNIVGTNIQGTLLVGTLTTGAQTNITSLGTLSSLSVTGNTTSGNLLTGGLISSTGNVTSGNLLTGGLISSTGNITGGNLSVGTGTVSLGGVVNNNANGVGNIGTSSTRFNTVFALATSAQYADLAEYYLADQAYTAGTVVAFGGTQEITLCDQDHDVMVAGIISHKPAFEMNAGLEGDHKVALALAGRVACQVLGPIKRGQMLVSAGGGKARAENDPRLGAVIGKALEDFDGTTGMIEVVVGRI